MTDEQSSSATAGSDVVRNVKHFSAGILCVDMDLVLARAERGKHDPVTAGNCRGSRPWRVANLLQYRAFEKLERVATGRIPLDSRTDQR